MDPRRAILTYHSLDDCGSVISVAPSLFARQMEALAASGVPVVPVADLRSAPAPAIALTFDDGYQNFADVAAPILARHRFPATVFIVAAYCGKTNSWPSQPASIPRLPLMGRSTITDLARAGVEFGSHTTTHSNLTGLDPEATRSEILGSKYRIEDSTGAAVRSFAYPYGAMTPTARRIVAENFAAGCSTRLGWVAESSSPEALERLDMYYLSHLALFRNLFTSPARWYLAFRRVLREFRA